MRDLKKNFILNCPKGRKVTKRKGNHGSVMLGQKAVKQFIHLCFSFRNAGYSSSDTNHTFLVEGGNVRY